MKSTIVIRWLAAILLVGMASFPGTVISSGSKSHAPVTSEIKGLEMSPQELRIRVRAMIRPTLGAVEEIGDGIIADTSDPVVRRGGLILKIEMSSTMLAAMLRSDPVLALADAWGYVLQVEGLLKRPDSKARFGVFAPRTADALARIEKQFIDFVASLQAGPFAEQLAVKVRKWADDHPIEGAIYRRPTVDSAVAKKLASSESGGVFTSLGDLEESTADVVTRLDLYTAYLPRLARWEAELTVDDLTRGVDARTLKAEFNRLTKAADRFAAVAETLSDLVKRERQVETRLMTETIGSLERVVDYAFLRLVQLLLICAALIALGVMVRAYLVRRRRHGE